MGQQRWATRIVFRRWGFFTAVKMQNCGRRGSLSSLATEWVPSSRSLRDLVPLLVSIESCDYSRDHKAARVGLRPRALPPASGGYSLFFKASSTPSISRSWICASHKRDLAQRFIGGLWQVDARMLDVGARPYPRFIRAELSRSQRSWVALDRVSCQCEKQRGSSCNWTAKTIGLTIPPSLLLRMR